LDKLWTIAHKLWVIGNYQRFLSDAHDKYVELDNWGVENDSNRSRIIARMFQADSIVAGRTGGRIVPSIDNIRGGVRQSLRGAIDFERINFSYVRPALSIAGGTLLTASGALLIVSPIPGGRIVGAWAIVNGVNQIGSGVADMVHLYQGNYYRVDNDKNNMIRRGFEWTLGTTFEAFGSDRETGEKIGNLFYYGQLIACSFFVSKGLANPKLMSNFDVNTLNKISMDGRFNATNLGDTLSRLSRFTDFSKIDFNCGFSAVSIAKHIVFR